MEEEDILQLPRGAHFDDEGILRDMSGRSMLDGLYRDEADELMMYEGESMGMFSEP
jgi:hypothetical protein